MIGRFDKPIFSPAAPLICIKKQRGLFPAEHLVRIYGRAEIGGQSADVRRNTHRTCR
jgi:hypothetical protein